MIFLGFDPGGRDAFGWAVLFTNEIGAPINILTGVTSSLTSAMNQVSLATDSPPIAVGIDSPLFWVADGDRRADAYVREMVCAAGGNAGTVSHVNSLRGACLVQGVLAAREVVIRWPNALVTEAHPKALLRVYPAAKDFIEQQPAVATEHERDALIAAYSALAFKMHKSGWCDLMLLETNPISPFGNTASYWFPCQTG